MLLGTLRLLLLPEEQLQQPTWAAWAPARAATASEIAALVPPLSAHLETEVAAQLAAYVALRYVMEAGPPWAHDAVSRSHVAWGEGRRLGFFFFFSPLHPWAGDG